MESWTGIPLKGFSDPGSAFAKKRLDIKRQEGDTHTEENEARKYQARILTVTLIFRRA